MAYPLWWEVRPKNVPCLKALNIHNSRDLIEQVLIHYERPVPDAHQPVTVGMRDVFDFSNQCLNSMHMKLRDAHLETPEISVKGRRPHTVITHTPALPPLMGEEDSDNYPPECYCPLTHEVFVDPVVAADGHTYERVAVETWLAKSESSPVTNMPLPRVVFPNRAMKAWIERLSA